MGLQTVIEPLELSAHKVLRIEDGLGTLVSCRRGDVWITQDQDARDVVLSAGESFRLDRPGLALVMAFKDASLLVESPLAQDRLAA